MLEIMYKSYSKFKGLQRHWDHNNELHFPLYLSQINNEPCRSSITLAAEKFRWLNTRSFLAFQTHQNKQPTAASRKSFWVAFLPFSMTINTNCSSELWPPMLMLHQLKNQSHTSWTVEQEWKRCSTVSPCILQMGHSSESMIMPLEAKLGLTGIRFCKSLQTKQLTRGGSHLFQKEVPAKGEFNTLSIMARNDLTVKKPLESPSHFHPSSSLHNTTWSNKFCKSSSLLEICWLLAIPFQD